MNYKQELFCKTYVETKNATKAAMIAGYSGRTAHSQGARLLKNVEIKKRINELIAEECKGLPNKLELKKFWAQLLRDENEKSSIRLAASTNLAKALFMFNYDVSGWDDVDIKESEVKDDE